MRYDDAAVLIGFPTYTGTVRAADEWNAAETERVSHYFYDRIARQLDAVIHFGETRAVVALGGPRGARSRNGRT